MFTGMMMFSVQSGAFWAPFFRKILILLDGFFPVRNLHHWLMWIFIIFAIIHIYLVFYHDYIEKNGIASSIIGGWKFIARPIVNDMEAENAMEHNVKMLEKQVKELKREKEVKRKEII
jgi:Ni,Fe-hydrogenase I cytochrome b subunit